MHKVSNFSGISCCYIKDKTSLTNFSDVSQMEWLETNGLGGWSGSSLSGCNTRRYHGLLMAAIHPPAERMLLVSKLDETIILDGNRYELGTNDYGDVIFPKGFHYLSSFQEGFFSGMDIRSCRHPHQEDHYDGKR